MGHRHLRTTLRRPLLSAETRVRAARQKWRVARSQAPHPMSRKRSETLRQATGWPALAQEKQVPRRADARLGMTTVWEACFCGAAEAAPFKASFFESSKLRIVVPAEAFVARATVHFNYGPQSRGMFEIYRETWCLLTCSAKARARGGVPTHAGAKRWRRGAWFVRGGEEWLVANKDILSASTLEVLH